MFFSPVSAATFFTASVNAGPVDMHGGNAHITPQTVPVMQDGVMTAQEFLIVRGHFGRISSKDPRFLNALHEQTAAVTQDPVIQRLIASHLVRVKGPNVKLSDDVMADMLEMYQQAIDAHPALLVLGPEFASGAPDADNLAVALQALDNVMPRPVNGVTLADALRAEIPLGRDAVFEDLYPVLRQWGEQIHPPEKATEFLEALPSRVSLAKIFILYPDPWPKKKHHKNRFISAANLDLLARRAAGGTRLHFRTDNADYFAWTQEHLAAHPQWQVEPDVTWPFEQKTFFEERMKDRRDVFARRAE
jgi:hypothetical protein